MTSVASARLSSSPYASGYSSSGSSEATSSCTSNYQSEQQSRRGLKRSNRYSGSQTYASDANAVSSSLGSGGYRADLSTAALSSAASEAAAAQSPSNNDAATSLPPNIAYLIRKNNISNFKQSTTSSSDEAAAVSSDPSVVKRQKTCAAAEMNHRLRTIRQDMERGGLKYPTQRKARVFPPKSFVDMSGVSLVSASSLLSEELNPFLFPKFSAVEAKTKNGGQYMECPLEIASLVQATSCFYQQPSAGIEQLPPAFSLALQKIQQQQQFVADQRRVELEKSASSASSSDGESDNSVSSFTASDGSGVREVAPHQRKTASSKPNVLPINEALSISRHPRYVLYIQFLCSSSDANVKCPIFLHIFPFLS